MRVLEPPSPACSARTIRADARTGQPGVHRMSVSVRVLERVGGRDLAEDEWVVHNRREHVDGRDEGTAIRPTPDDGVVSRVTPDDQVGVTRRGQAAQDLRQVTRSELARSAGAVGQRRQANRRVRRRSLRSRMTMELKIQIQRHCIRRPMAPL